MTFAANALDNYITGNYGEDQLYEGDNLGIEPEDGYVEVEVTYIETGRVEIMTMDEAREHFGDDEMQEILMGHMPHIVATIL